MAGTASCCLLPACSWFLSFCGRNACCVPCVSEGFGVVSKGFGVLVVTYYWHHVDSYGSCAILADGCCTMRISAGVFLCTYTSGFKLNTPFLFFYEAFHVRTSILTVSKKLMLEGEQVLPGINTTNEQYNKKYRDTEMEFRRFWVNEPLPFIQKHFQPKRASYLSRI